jgi:excisionase family DNA binding protein
MREAATAGPRLLTVAEAASLLAVRPGTIRKWIAEDSIPYISLPASQGRQSARYRIPLDGLLTSLSGTYELAPEEPPVDDLQSTPESLEPSPLSSEAPDRWRVEEVSGVVGPDGRALWPGDAELESITVSVRRVTTDLLLAVSQRPERMRELHWRDFEHLMAELFAREGWDVELTAGSGDGGVDLYAARNDRFGSMLYVVECKRYAPDRRIGPELVRGLYGVVERERATRGVLATTSYFTPGARGEEQMLQHRVSLSDFDALSEWVRGTDRRDDDDQATEGGIR